MARTPVEGYFNTISIIRDPMRDALFSDSFKAQLAGYNAIDVFNRHAANASTDDPLALIQYLDYKTYLAVSYTHLDVYKRQAFQGRHHLLPPSSRPAW